jgi:hypothetical protein
MITYQSSPPKMPTYAIVVGMGCCKDTTNTIDTTTTGDDLGLTDVTSTPETTSTCNDEETDNTSLCCRD